MNNYYIDIFNLTKNKFQASRFPSLDLARLLAIIFMIQGHTIFELASPHAINFNEFPWSWWNFFRGVTAPIFFMVSGAVHVFANKRNSDGTIPQNIILKRITNSILLIIIGYLFLFPANRFYDLFFIDYQCWQTFFQVNVLQLFGISLLMLTELFLLTKNDKSFGFAALSVGIFITLLTPFMYMIDWYGILPDVLAAYFSQKHGSTFIIFPFSSFLFFGAAIGTYLKILPEEKRLDNMTRLGVPAGVLVVAIGIGFHLLLKSFNIEHFSSYPASSGMVFIRAGIVLVILSMSGFLYKRTKQLGKFYSYFGRKALLIYCLHLIVLYGTPVFPSLTSFFKGSLNLVQSLGAVLLVELVTIGIVLLIDQSFRKFPKFKVFLKYSMTAYIIYAFFI